MTEDRSPKASEESMMANGATKQRKKRKWDQPAESLMPAGVDVTGTLPLGVDGIYGSALLGLVPQSGPLLTNPTPTSFVSASQILQPPLVPPTSASGVQKLIQPKIQDELIAREIVINDADPSTRYKLTKRQTQEEIQKCTGAVVITRGKYRPPNALPDGEKPLYLHISAGAQLKDTVERIKAVDSAAYMVEEILRQGQNSLPNSTILPSVSSNGQATHSLSLCLYLGFDPVPSLNIVSRIRGPNDQYINHIMNETGATVVLRGRGSGNVDTLSTEEAEQPLHLYLSSSNSKNLEDARILAENLLDTICAECGASRVLSSKTYGAVPPPQQLLGGASSTNSGPSCLPVSSMPAALLVPNGQPSSSNTCAPEMVQAGGLFCYGNPQQSNVSYVRPSVNGGTSYSGYGGIYPQATPLQQVALALRQSSPSTTSIPASTSQVSGLPMTTPSSGSSGAETDKRPPQKRKFQELPVSSKGATMLHQNLRQESEFLKPGLEDSGAKEHSLVLPQTKLVRPVSNLMPPPPPPPKFSSPVEAENGSSTIKKPIPEPKFFSSVKAENRNSTLEKPKPERVTVTRTKSSSTGPISDTLLKLMEYGEEDEDDDGADEEPCISRASDQLKAKPFWAV